MTKNILTKLLARMAPAILFFAPALGSASTISLVPSSTVVTVGDTFTVDLIASDLQLGGYDVTFGYNPLLGGIDLDHIDFDVHLGGPANSFAAWIATLDTLELTEVSFLTSPADLMALQGDPCFALAHIPVTALIPGVLSLDFTPSPFFGATDYSGAPIEGVNYVGASITILPAAEPPASEAPEPHPAVLILTGVCLVAAARLGRRMQNRKVAAQCRVLVAGRR